MSNHISLLEFHLRIQYGNGYPLPLPAGIAVAGRGSGTGYIGQAGVRTAQGPFFFDGLLYGAFQAEARQIRIVAYLGADVVALDHQRNGHPEDKQTHRRYGGYYKYGKW